MTSRQLGVLPEDEVPVFKVVLIGDPEVGKSSVFLRYTKNQFDYSYQPTTSVNIANVVRKVNVPDHVVVSVTLWDLPGREDVDLRRSYYKDIDAAIVVVDLMDKQSIELAGSWKQDILNNTLLTQDVSESSSDGKENTSPNKARNVPVLLLGNKYDQILKREREKADHEGEVDVVKDSPAEVQELERVAELHGFVGSVLVSAKESDNSVHRAMQSLVRHLLERKLQQKLAKKKGGNKQSQRKKRKASQDTDSFATLEEVGLEEIDDLLHQCNPPLKKLTQCSSALEKSLDQFRRTCVQTGMVTAATASLEDCICGVRDKLGEGNSLEAVDDGGFLQLVVKGEGEVLEEVTETLQVFNTQVVVSSKAVLQHCPAASTMLTDLDTKVSAKADAIWDTAKQAGKTAREVKQAQATITRNRACIAQARTGGAQSLKTVDSSYQKIKAALLW
uniref:Uncharacterized protein n=1 Tax=Branchiostoma floridae TaxID=7739 RepID=C3YID0_BRAFL|eukprot:XP_002604256.1 hypothetical protein BRAFLDRAFT_73394 [Branchiostoma floridae]